MKQDTYALIVIVLLSVALIAGCTSTSPPAAGADVPKIKSQEEVQKVTENVTKDIGNVKNTLNDLDKSFG